MNAPRPVELARRLFGSVRREQPSAELRARILAAGRAELERARGVSSIEERHSLGDSPEQAAAMKRRDRARLGRRSAAIAALAAAAGLFAYLGAGPSTPSSVMISAEHASSLELPSRERIAPTQPGHSSEERVPAIDVAPADDRAAPRLPRASAANEASRRAAPASSRPGKGTVASDPKAAPLAAVHALPPAARDETATAARPDAPARASLGEQLEQIKAIRAAVRGGDPRRALQLIDGYRAGGNGGELAAEASLLRIEALAMSGQKAEATEAARQFARDYPNSPLIDRALSYAGAAD